MKKARFILGAVAALGIVGSVFAFKVRSEDTLYIRAAGQNQCTLPIKGVTLTTTSPTQPSVGFSFVTEVAGACPARLSYYQGN